MIDRLTLKEILELISKKQISAYELTSKYLEICYRLNPKLNAFITINENALKDAKKKDEKRDKIGKIYAVPIAIKDNFLTKGIRTTAASKVLDNYLPQYNAYVVQKLLDEGAIILGKTNLDAWAHGSSTETSDYGVTKNPWDLERVSGGSSGGSACCVSANMSVLAVGSETAGSIRGPASWCGVVGLKPTYGRISRYGLIAMGSSLDCPGILSKTVYDSALLLEIIAGKDKYDATTVNIPVGKYTESLGKEIKGVRIGIPKEYLIPEISKKIKISFEKAAKVLEKLGAKISYVSLLNPKFAISVYTVLQRAEVSSNLARYDGIRYGNGRDFFGQEAKRRIVLGTFVLSEGYSDKFYKKAQKVRTLFIKDFERVFKEVDILIAPTMPNIAPKLGVTKDSYMFGEIADILLEPSAIAGLPAISIPCGFAEGMPVGLDIIGPQFSEEKILQVAYAYEAETKWFRYKPKL